MRWMVVVLVAVGMVSGAFVGCSHFTGKSTGESLDDTVISGDIKGKILADSELKIFAVDVAVNHGNVTLSGIVPNEAAKQRLIKMVQDVKGVKSIKTNLQVAPPKQKPAPKQG